MLVPMMDEVADILGIARGIYWIQDVTIITSLIKLLRGEDVKHFDDILEILRQHFPNMLPMDKAKEIAMGMDLSDYQRMWYVLGIPDRVVKEWKRNMRDRYEEGTVLHIDVDDWFRLYKFENPSGRKPCASLSQFEYPELVDLRYYAPDREKIA